eukprot:7730665-Pyramimonas_sp.AAC.1
MGAQGAIAIASVAVLDTFAEFGLPLNFGVGESDALFAVAGPGSNQGGKLLWQGGAWRPRRDLH